MLLAYSDASMTAVFFEKYPFRFGVDVGQALSSGYTLDVFNIFLGSRLVILCIQFHFFLASIIAGRAIDRT